MNISHAILSTLLLASPARAALRVVATVPELVDITKQIGGDHVKVDGLARGTEDIHQVVMKPSFVTKLNRADALIFLGLTLEHSFLPGLLEVARNSALRADWAQTCSGKGCIDCSIGVRVLEKPDTLSRAQGELHPQGNPHYNLDPRYGSLIAKNIAEGLARLDPEHAGEYGKNGKAYAAALEQRLAEWRKRAAALKGMKAVSFHKDVPYLADFTGLEVVDTVELKPGIAPTPTHLAELVRKMKADGVTLIVREQQYDPKTVDWLAGQTGAKVAVIGTMANSLPGTETFMKLSEHNLKAVLAAVGK